MCCIQLLILQQPLCPVDAPLSALCCVWSFMVELSSLIVVTERQGNQNSPNSSCNKSNTNRMEKIFKEKPGQLLRNAPGCGNVHMSGETFWRQQQLLPPEHPDQCRNVPEEHLTRHHLTPCFLNVDQDGSMDQEGSGWIRRDHVSELNDALGLCFSAPVCSASITSDLTFMPR